MMKRKNIYIISSLLLIQGLFYACEENIREDAFYTFTGETVASFCGKTEENNLSVFARLIEESGYYPLLSVYGHFTCFAPTDAAFDAYFRAEGIQYDNLSKEDKKKIVDEHIIKGVSREYLYDDFQVGALPLPNMGSRYLVVSFSEDEAGNSQRLVNKDCPVINWDNKVHNGVVHVIGNVIKASTFDLLSMMKEAGHFNLFAEAFALTHLNDSISELYDYTYEDPSPNVDKVNVADRADCVIPHTRKLGYTILAETDAVFEQAGIHSLPELIALAKRYYGTEVPDDYTHRNNPLNKFISYHIMDRQMSTNAFIYQGKNTTAYAMDKRYEYYETMLKMRLIEFKAGNKINTQKDGVFVGVDESSSNLEGLNGYIHALTDILVYDEVVMIEDVLNKRIRFDAHAVPPQLTNNNIRWKTLDQPMTITPEFCGDYFQFNPATKIIMWASEWWDAHQADEIIMIGWYDFTLRLPPVPPGTYEIRFGYNSVDWRGIAQLFIDGQICGIPVNLAMKGDNPMVGWIKDSNTPDNGVENDKMMRNRGYMKSGNAILNSGYELPLRESQNDLRVIVGTFTWQDYDYHYFRAKNVERELGEFQLDYIEYVPVSHLNVEDRD
jgi:uncharacterized surface protein with fasciclin (FAS1) repeats